MTLTDDNFATIVDAVREGRGIYENIKKAVAFLLGTNIGEVLTVFCAMLMWHRAPLVSMQLLWINLVTDSLPAIALGMEPVEAGAMERPPRPAGEGLFAHGLGLRVGLQGALFAALTLIGYFWGWRSSGDPAIGQTWAFIVLALSQVLHAFNMRSMRSLFAIGPFGNRQLNRAALISAALIALVLFVPPLRNAFELRPLAAQGYLISVALAAAPVPLMELYKAISRAARAADR
ncbi:MAG: cation-transporting P-type ATPase, partial [Clostridiales bacterium]|nr:cation-transporting P-type ATPase [Clostridiales bacterium]